MRSAVAPHPCGATGSVRHWHGATVRTGCCKLGDFSAKVRISKRMTHKLSFSILDTAHGASCTFARTLFCIYFLLYFCMSDYLNPRTTESRSDSCARKRGESGAERLGRNRRCAPRAFSSWQTPLPPSLPRLALTDWTGRWPVFF